MEEKDLDIANVVQDTIKEEGFECVLLQAPDARKHTEYVRIMFGTPGETTTYYDESEDIPLRITVLCVFKSELASMLNAQRIERAIRERSLDSRNGSYNITGLRTDKPRPMLWDQSGRFVWVFDINISIERIY